MPTTVMYVLYEQLLINHLEILSRTDMKFYVIITIISFANISKIINKYYILYICIERKFIEIKNYDHVF